MILTTPYTIADFLATIRRELAKRETTYPKIIANKVNRLESQRRIQNELARQRVQMARLRSVHDIIADGMDYIDAPSANDYLRELEREMKMREQVYARFVFFKRIKPEVAEQEKAVWRALVQYWKETYCDRAIIHHEDLIPA